MQRASSTTQHPITPASETSFKRRKTDHTPDSSVPTTPVSEPKAFVDRSEVQAALKAESAYEALVAARRAETGFGSNEYETRWVLDVNIPAHNGVNATEEGEESSEDEEDDWVESNGRQTYGSYKRKRNAGTTSSTADNPARDSNAIDLISGEEEDEDEFTDDNSEDDPSTPSRLKKRKAAAMDLTDQAAMSALDNVDLSRSSYARSKGAHGAPAKPIVRDRGKHPKDRRGDKHPKKNKNNNRNKNKKR